MSGLEVIAIAGLVINGMSMFNELVRTWLQFRKERKEAKAAKALDEGLEHEMEATTTQLAFGRLWLEYAKSQNAGKLPRMCEYLLLTLSYKIHRIQLHSARIPKRDKPKFRLSKTHWRGRSGL